MNTKEAHMDTEVGVITITVAFIFAVGILANHFSQPITGNQVLLFEQTVHCPLPDKLSCDTCCEQIGGRSDGNICRYSAVPATIPNNQESYTTCVQNLGYGEYLTR